MLGKNFGLCMFHAWGSILQNKYSYAGCAHFAPTEMLRSVCFTYQTHLYSMYKVSQSTNIKVLIQECWIYLTMSKCTQNHVLHIYSPPLLKSSTLYQSQISARRLTLILDLWSKVQTWDHPPLWAREPPARPKIKIILFIDETSCWMKNHIF